MLKIKSENMVFDMSSSSECPLPNRKHDAPFFHTFLTVSSSLATPSVKAMLPYTLRALNG